MYGTGIKTDILVNGILIFFYRDSHAYRILLRPGPLPSCKNSYKANLMIFLKLLFSHNAMSEYIFLTLQVFCFYIMFFDFVIGFWFCDLGDFCVSIVSLCLYVILVLSLSLFAFLFICFFCHIWTRLFYLVLFIYWCLFLFLWERERKTMLLTRWGNGGELEESQERGIKIRIYSMKICFQFKKSNK